MPKVSLFFPILYLYPLKTQKLKKLKTAVNSGIRYENSIIS